MEKNHVTVTLKIRGMTCVNCENRIERTLKNKKGIANAIVSYGKGTALVTYDPGQTDMVEIVKAVEDLGYGAAGSNEAANTKRPRLSGSRPGHGAARDFLEPESRGSNAIQAVGILVILLALYVMISHCFGGLELFNYFPQASESTGYGMLFVIGLLTSAHCIAMCGGINLSQCVPFNASRTAGNKASARADRNKASALTAGNMPSAHTVGNRASALMPSFLYNSGRVISYTAIGGLVGALGSAVSFSNTGKGVVTLIAGAFMIVMGLNMLNFFPWLRRLNPRMPKIFAVKINEQKNSNRPFYVGLLNGLMPCGPLQAMQLYALSTGDPVKGAVSMLIFSLGTVPLMFGLGALSSVLTKKYTEKMMTVGAALVILLGFFMLTRGMALGGFAFPFSSGPDGRSVSSSAAEQGVRAEVADGVQEVTTSLDSGRYEPITVQKGIPVKWNIQADARSINGCNNRIVIPQYDLEKPLQPGDNIIEFTPDETGVVGYSCWMGMIRSRITIVDQL